MSDLSAIVEEGRRMHSEWLSRPCAETRRAFEEWARDAAPDLLDAASANSAAASQGSCQFCGGQMMADNKPAGGNWWRATCQTCGAMGPAHGVSGAAVADCNKVNGEQPGACRYPVIQDDSARPWIVLNGPAGQHLARCGSRETAERIAAALNAQESQPWRTAKQARAAEGDAQ